RGRARAGPPRPDPQGAGAALLVSPVPGSNRAQPSGSPGRRRRRGNGGRGPHDAAAGIALGGRPPLRAVGAPQDPSRRRDPSGGLPRRHPDRRGRPARDRDADPPGAARPRPLGLREVQRAEMGCGGEGRAGGEPAPGDPRPTRGRPDPTRRGPDPTAPPLTRRRVSPATARTTAPHRGPAAPATRSPSSSG